MNRQQRRQMKSLKKRQQHQHASLCEKREQRQSVQLQADKQPLTWADVRRKVNEIAVSRGEWAGYPMLVEGLKLRMEPRFPIKSMHGASLGPEKEVLKQDFEILNTWYCWRRQANVYVCRDPDGKSRSCCIGDAYGRRFNFWFNTVRVASEAWDMNVEARALEKLRGLVTSHAFSCYTLGGAFVETSPRSGIQYVFRKLRPTVALRGNADDTVRILAVLCMHPLGHYEDSWAGVMCPTDDVIAHLLMMRADEHLFWRKANHHSPWLASAGI